MDVSFTATSKLLFRGLASLDLVDLAVDVFRKSNIGVDLQSYNMHCLLRLHEGRITFSLPSQLNEYGYENLLQHFK